MEPLNVGIEIDEADRDARHADDRQADPVTLVLDELAFFDIGVERVGEDVDRVEPEFLGHPDPERRLPPRLRPCRIDQSEFHGGHLEN